MDSWPGIDLCHVVKDICSIRKWHTYTVHVQLLCTCDALGNGVDDVHHGSLSFCVSFSLPVRVCACVCVFACVCVYVWHVVVASIDVC